jgi:hypothetical protein
MLIDIRNVKIKTQRATIVPTLLYGCETWSLILTQVRRLRVFKDSVLLLFPPPPLPLPLPSKGFWVLYSTLRSKVHHSSFHFPLGLLKYPCPRSPRRSGYMIWRPLHMFLPFLTVLPNFMDHTVFPNLPENLFTSDMASAFTPTNDVRNDFFLSRGYVVLRSSALTRV